jgi:hypothetical protein
MDWLRAVLLVKANPSSQTTARLSHMHPMAKLTFSVIVSTSVVYDTSHTTQIAKSRLVCQVAWKKMVLETGESQARGASGGI